MLHYDPCLCVSIAIVFCGSDTFLGPRASVQRRTSGHHKMSGNFVCFCCLIPLRCHFTGQAELCEIYFWVPPDDVPLYVHIAWLCLIVSFYWIFAYICHSVLCFDKLSFLVVGTKYRKINFKASWYWMTINLWWQMCSTGKLWIKPVLSRYWHDGIYVEFMQISVVHPLPFIIEQAKRQVQQKQDPLVFSI